MKRHSRRRGPSIIVAFLLLACSVLVAISAIQLLAGQSPVIPFSRLAVLGRDLHWQDDIVVAAGGVVAALGLVLLVCALVPGKLTVLPLADPPDGSASAHQSLDAGVTRRSARHAMRRSAKAVDGATTAQLRLRRHTVIATIGTHRHDPAGLDTAVGQAIGRCVDELGLAQPPRPRVRVVRRRTRR